MRRQPIADLRHRQRRCLLMASSFGFTPRGACAGELRFSGIDHGLNSDGTFGGGKHSPPEDFHTAVFLFTELFACSHIPLKTAPTAEPNSPSAPKLPSPTIATAPSPTYPAP